VRLIANMLLKTLIIRLGESAAYVTQIQLQPRSNVHLSDREIERQIMAWPRFRNDQVRETAAPPVTLPKRRDFGSTVIVTLAEMSVEGSIDLQYRHTGAAWRLACNARRR
jgi:hypothetical protein